MIIQVLPAPACPECGGNMQLKKPKLGQTWKAFWSCVQWPSCKGTRRILLNGKPDMGETPAWNDPGDYIDDGK